MSKKPTQIRNSVASNSFCCSSTTNSKRALELITLSAAGPDFERFEQLSPSPSFWSINSNQNANIDISKIPDSKWLETPCSSSTTPVRSFNSNLEACSILTDQYKMLKSSIQSTTVSCVRAPPTIRKVVSNPPRGMGLMQNTEGKNMLQAEHSPTYHCGPRNQQMHQNRNCWIPTPKESVKFGATVPPSFLKTSATGRKTLEVPLDARTWRDNNLTPAKACHSINKHMMNLPRGGRLLGNKGKNNVHSHLNSNLVHRETQGRRRKSKSPVAMMYVHMEAEYKQNQENCSVSSSECTAFSVKSGSAEWREETMSFKRSVNVVRSGFNDFVECFYCHNRFPIDVVREHQRYCSERERMPAHEPDQVQDMYRHEAAAMAEPVAYEPNEMVWPKDTYSPYGIQEIDRQEVGTRSEHSPYAIQEMGWPEAVTRTAYVPAEIQEMDRQEALTRTAYRSDRTQEMRTEYEPDLFQEMDQRETFMRTARIPDEMRAMRRTEYDPAMVREMRTARLSDGIREMRTEYEPDMFQEMRTTREVDRREAILRTTRLPEESREMDMREAVIRAAYAPDRTQEMDRRMAVMKSVQEYNDFRERDRLVAKTCAPNFHKVEVMKRPEPVMIEGHARDELREVNSPHTGMRIPPEHNETQETSCSKGATVANYIPDEAARVNDELCRSEVHSRETGSTHIPEKIRPVYFPDAGMEIFPAPDEIYKTKSSRPEHVLNNDKQRCNNSSDATAVRPLFIDDCSSLANLPRPRTAADSEVETCWYCGWDYGPNAACQHFPRCERLRSAIKPSPQGKKLRKIAERKMKAYARSHPKRKRML